MFRLEIPPLTVKETRIPDNESPCFMINHIKLVGERSADFQWLLRSVTATPSEITSPLVFINNKKDASSLGVLGRCLGVTGIGVVMRQMQKPISCARLCDIACSSGCPRPYIGYISINTRARKNTRDSFL